jgi:hypothetical protein
MPKPHVVTTADGRRTLFRGDEDSARDYIENNFPRVHSEPGTDYGDEGPTPDAVLKAPDGTIEHFNGAEWVLPNDSTDDPDTNATPKLGDNLAAWRAYAAAQGDEDADSKTKKQLVGEYTTED